MNRYLDWFEQAKRDLEKAKLDYANKFYEWACFTCQQSAEKAVKALGMKLSFDLWGHSIFQMLKVITEKIPIEEKLLNEAKLLDLLYIPSRYPNGFSIGKPSDYYTEKQALEAIDAAVKIIGFCESYISG
ncbi:MAG: HEPN domain-containing protein [Exilispira sp.]